MQLSREILAKPAHLYEPRDGYRIFWGAGALIENLRAGANPPSGIFIYYWLKDKNQEVSLDILDASGAVVNSFTSRPDSATVADSLRLESKKRVRNDSLRAAGVTDSVQLNAPYVEPPPEEEPNKLASLPRAPNSQGLNLFNWTFRYADGIALTDTTVQLQRVPGATALPGSFAVRLTVAGKAAVQRFTLLADPRVRATPADFRARFVQAQRVNRAIGEVIGTINDISALRAQVETRRKAAAGGRGGNAALDATLHRFADSLSTWSRRLAPRRTVGFDWDLYSTSSLGELQRFTFGDMNSAPSQAERTGSVEALARARQRVGEVKGAIGAALPAVNEALKAAGQAPLVAGAGLAPS